MVTAPVGACHLHQFEVLELAGAGHVGTTAQVFKLAFAIKRDIFVCRNTGNDLRFVLLTQALEVLHRLVTRQYAANHRLIFAGQFSHLLFDSHQIFGGEGALVREVVKESMLNHRADRHLRIRKQLLDGISQQMGCGMSNDLQPICIFGGDDRQRTVRRHLKTGVDHLAVHFARQRSLSQSGTNRGRDLSDSYRAGEFTFGAVRKCDVDHGGV